MRATLFTEVIAMAFDTVRTNKMRSGLTVLGVVIGITSIVGMTAMIRGFDESLRQSVREIGLRKALGARRSDIMAQMLTESVVLSVFGGVVGTLFGATIATVISSLTPVPAAIEPWSVALGITAVVGLFFGLYPAIRAASLDPIEALRRE